MRPLAHAAPLPRGAPVLVRATGIRAARTVNAGCSILGDFGGVSAGTSVCVCARARSQGSEATEQVPINTNIPSESRALVD